MTIWIVHGIHTNDCVDWQWEMTEEFAKADMHSQVFSYGYAHAFTTRWQNPGRAQRLAERLENGDVLVGHSNGGDIIHRASWLRPEVILRGVFLFNPALDPDLGLGCEFDFCKVMHNAGDRAVRLAKIFLAHPWGEMGRVGYKGSNPKYENIDTRMLGINNPRCYNGHSGFQGCVPAWTEWMVKVINGNTP